MDRKIVELLLQKKSCREIMRVLKVGDRRVERVRALAEQYGYLSETPIPAYPAGLFLDGPDGRNLKPSEPNSLLLAKKDWIVERLGANWHPITVFEELGLGIGRSSFYRFLDRHGLREVGMRSRARVVPEIVHQPGEALILDWGKLRDVIDPETGKKRCLWAFVGVLGFSRYMMVRLVWSNETQTTLQAIEHMLQEMGGVPFKITSDNPKCFAIEASDYEPLLNPCFERFASYYNIIIECLPPADPEKKGKVERLMPFVRRLYESHGSQWQGIEESQSYMDRKVAIANERCHGTTRKKPTEQFIEVEVSKLKPLPSIAYSPEQVLSVKVRKDGHVRFANKYYSLPEALINKEVTLLASIHQITIYHEGKLIEVHTRLQADDLRSTSTKDHHRKPWERAMMDHSTYRKRAQTIGGDCDRLILILLNQGQGFMDTRKIWGILSLDKIHSSEAINQACRQAIELHSYSYQTVKRLLRLMPLSVSKKMEVNKIKPLQDQSELSLTQVPHKFVRPMSVYEEQLSLLLH